WRGSILKNRQIARTLREFEQMEKSKNAPQKNWRFELALYRACYDSFLQTRLATETAQRQKAIAALQAAPNLGVEHALERAEATLEPSHPAVGNDLRAHIFDLGEDLFAHIGLQLSVPLYGASNWERGANL